MPSAAEVLDQIQNLPQDEQYKIVNTVLENAVALTQEENQSTTEVLRDRADGPFIQYSDDMIERVKERGRQYLAKRENGSAD